METQGKERFLMQWTAQKKLKSYMELKYYEFESKSQHIIIDHKQ